jgi:hypothetical protein
MKWVKRYTIRKRGKRKRGKRNRGKRKRGKRKRGKRKRGKRKTEIERYYKILQWLKIERKNEREIVTSRGIESEITKQREI